MYEADGILENAGGQNMSVTSFTDNSGGSIPGSGTESFQVGATLSVGSNQPTGTYSSSIGGGDNGKTPLDLYMIYLVRVLQFMLRKHAVLSTFRLHGVMERTIRYFWGW